MMVTEIYLPEGAGPCAKQIVTATLVSVDGRRYVSTNFCMTPQKECPRGDMPSGVGYHLCKEVCNQIGHAEENAISAAEKDNAVQGSTIYVEGHIYACDNCQKVAKHAGVVEIIVGAPQNT